MTGIEIDGTSQESGASGIVVDDAENANRARLKTKSTAKFLDFEITPRGVELFDYLLTFRHASSAECHGSGHFNSPRRQGNKPASPQTYWLKRP